MHRRVVFIIKFGIPVFALIFAVFTSLSLQAKVEIKEDWLYTDGEKFLVRGVGYSPFRIGRGYETIPNWLIEEDFRRIREAGFNTILTWDVIPERVIDLARVYGLKIIMGIWIEPSGPFDDAAFLRKSIDKVRVSIEQTKDHENVIIYLIMGEPDPESILKSGLDNTVNFYKKLAEISHESAPERPVGMSNWIKSSWLDMSSFDIVCYNLYGHDFDETRANIGIGNYISWLKSRPDIKGKPFFVTEFGHSVSPEGEGSYGYGGNTLEEQATGDVRLYREMIQSGTIGACVFEWNDKWWKAGEPRKHNPTTEEWFGIIGIENENDLKGTPRPVYYALQEAFKLLVVNPKGMARFSGKVPLDINALPSVTAVEYRVNYGDWIPLGKDGSWWRGEWDSTSKPDGEKIIRIQGIEAGKRTKLQELHIWTYNPGPVPPEPLQLEVTTDKPEYHSRDMMKITVTLTNKDHNPIVNHPVDIAFETPYRWKIDNWNGFTDHSGRLVKEIQLLYEQAGYYHVYISASYQEGDFLKRYSRVLQFWLE